MNYEINRIQKQIIESPYKIRDLGIQVMVEPPNPENLNRFPEERREDIRQLLSTIVRTSIDKGIGTDISDEAIQNKVIVSVNPFNGKTEMEPTSTSKLPWWIYVVGGLLLAIIGLLTFFVIRTRSVEVEEEEILIDEKAAEPITIPDLEDAVVTESGMRRKQLEKSGVIDKPDEFAKLLRTWFAED